MLLLLLGCKITIISGCGYSFRCGTSTSVCSVLPQHAHLSWRRGGGRQKGGEGKASCQKGWQTQQAESFLAWTSAWLGGAARAAACLRGDISLNKAEDRLGLGGLLGLFHLEGIAPPPPTLKTKERKERGCCFSCTVGQTAFQFHECGLYSCSLFGERYVIHNTKTLKHDLLNFAFGLLRV